MQNLILLSGVVLISCALFQKMFAKTSVPGLFLFIILGMIFGTDGLLKIPFDNYTLAGDICTAALVLIMYYGGLGTNIRAARPVLGRALVLSCLGSFLTAGFVGLFTVYVLGLGPLEGLLLGSVICSTDAASVFAILRSRKMNLKYHTASLLEVESGSNDPFSYMLTVIVMTLLEGGSMSAASVALMLVLQIVVGVAAGAIMALVLTRTIPKLRLKDPILTEALILGAGLITYAGAVELSGNGYLAVYLAGIVIGNSRIPEKLESLRFFDSLTGLMQMLLFFMLGLLASPSRLPGVATPALLTALFLTFVARPAAIFLLLAPFRCKLRQMLFVSFAGMRGAASIAFAIMAIGTSVSYDLFHIIFFIVLFSILVQGSLIPPIARKLDMIDDSSDVMATFNDYMHEMPVQFVRFIMKKGHAWVGKRIADVIFPPGSILVAIQRRGEQIIPGGSTVLEEGDELIMCGLEGGEVESSGLYEVHLHDYDGWVGRRLYELSLKNELIVLIRRGEETKIPSGNTTLLAGDDLYVLRRHQPG